MNKIGPYTCQLCPLNAPCQRSNNFSPTPHANGLTGSTGLTPFTVPIQIAIDHLPHSAYISCSWCQSIQLSNNLYLLRQFSILIASLVFLSYMSISHLLVNCVSRSGFFLCLSPISPCHSLRSLSSTRIRYGDIILSYFSRFSMVSYLPQCGCLHIPFTYFGHQFIYLTKQKNTTLILYNPNF